MPVLRLHRPLHALSLIVTLYLYGWNYWGPRHVHADVDLLQVWDFPGLDGEITLCLPMASYTKAPCS